MCVTIKKQNSMKLIKKFTFFTLLLLTSICFGQNEFSDFDFWKNKILNDENLDLVKQSLESNDFIISYDKEEIPKQLNDIFSAWNNEPFIIANPNEDFNSTDFVNDSLPNRQLISLFRNNDFLIINYKHGGFGFHHHIIWCKINENEINDIWICNTYNSIDNYSELRKEFVSFTRTTTLKNGKTIKQNYLCF